MLKRITLVSTLALVPFASQAQALLNVSGQWEYRDASKMETDEGLNLCFQLDSASIARSPQLRQHGGALCASNASAGAKLLGLPQSVAKAGCRYDAKGVAAVGLTGLTLLPEDEMYDERLQARLVSVKDNRIVSPLAMDCGTTADASSSFKNIHDAIAALKAHPDFGTLSASDFARIDAVTGLAELDAATQMYLPSGSTDTLVAYYDGNSGIHELTAYRYAEGKWSNVSREVLPGYQEDVARFRGTNFYLDAGSVTPKVRTLPDKKAWHYVGGRFVREQ